MRVHPKPVFQTATGHMNLDHRIEARSVYCGKRIKTEVYGIAVQIMEVQQLTATALVGNCRHQTDLVADLNLDSLALVELLDRVEQTFSVTVDDAVLGSARTVAGWIDALDAARRMGLALDDLNEALSGDLDQPLRIGIGLHSGPTIVGQMGYERATQLTAIGDTVNTASRLETLTKEFGVELVVSQELLDRAGIDLAAYERHDVEIRGRQERLAVRAVKRATDLTAMS